MDSIEEFSGIGPTHTFILASQRPAQTAAVLAVGLKTDVVKARPNVGTYYNVNISTAPSANGTWSGGSPDVWTPNATGSNVSVSAISARLNAGTSVVINTAAGGTEDGDIFLIDPVSWGTNAALTLSAYRNINFNCGVNATGNTAGLTLTPNNTGAGGSYFLNNNAAITLSGSAPSLMIAGNAYTVINSLGVAGDTSTTTLQGMINGLAGRYALGSNIDASATSTWNGGAGFVPVGDSTTAFTGAFDGLNHTISGLTINRSSADGIGLFGYTGAGCVLKNVGLDGGSVSGRKYVGGMVGANDADIFDNSYNTGSVTGTGGGYSGVGGLVGSTGGTPITNSYSTGSVTGTGGGYGVGGMVGLGNTGTISNCYSTGTVSGSGNDVGGLVGNTYHGGGIINSYSTGNVSGGGNWVGGLVGWNNNHFITNSYSTGTVSGGGPGGLVGYNNGGPIIDSYWNTTTSGRSNCVGGGNSAGCTGLSMAQMKQQASFSGWDFSNVWSIDPGISYPQLRAFIGTCATCAPPPANMISWWPGDGNANDIQGVNNGVLVNGVTYIAGLVSRAFHFNGANQYVQVPTSNLGFERTSAFSMDAWIRTSETTNNGFIAAKAQGSLPYAGYNLFINNGVAPQCEPHNPTPPGAGRLGFGLTAPLIAGTCPVEHAIMVSGTTSLNDGQWHHVAMTYDGSSTAAGVKLYVDGAPETVLVQQDTLGSNSILNSAPFTIGSRQNGDVAFNGDIDELEVFSTVIAGTDVASIYSAGSAGKCRTCTPAPVGLVSWWSGDGIASDIRGYNNGIAEGNLTFGSGKAAQGFSFDGSTADVRIPASLSLDVGVGGGMTIDMWVKPASVNQAPLAEWGASTIDAHFWIGGNLVPGNLFVNLIDTGGNYHILQSAGGIALANEWQHVALTYDKASGIATLYLNGSAVAGPTNIGSFTPKTSADLYFGHRVISDQWFNGAMDEVEVFDRALSAAEIQAIVNAGSSGKCKPTPVKTPSGVVAWWGGDGDARDLTGNGNSGAPQNGAGYAVGKVGQSFNFDGTDDHISVADASILNPTSQLSIEAWVYPVSDSAGLADFSIILNKEVESAVQYELGRKNNSGCNSGSMATGNVGFYIGGIAGLPSDCNGWVNGNANLPLNTWSHIALTFDGATTRVYLNSLLTRAIPSTGSISTSNGELRIGTRTAGVTDNPSWMGMMDEITIYNSGLSTAEIESIYQAGLAGKLKSQITPANTFAEPRNMKQERTLDIPGIQLGDATVTLPIVSTGGVTQQIPLDPAKLPPLPMGATPTNLTYDISTSAVWSGTPSVCFNLPALSSVYRNLRILHLENGVWVNRTQVPGVNPILCTYGLTSLSPFTIADFGPTAAHVSISGRVMTKSGNGVLNAIVQLTDQQGITRTARSSTFGYYRFDDVPAGENYVIGVASKRFVFTPRTINVSEELTDVVLIAETK